MNKTLVISVNPLKPLQISTHKKKRKIDEISKTPCDELCFHQSDSGSPKCLSPLKKKHKKKDEKYGGLFLLVEASELTGQHVDDINSSHYFVEEKVRKPTKKKVTRKYEQEICLDMLTISTVNVNIDKTIGERVQTKEAVYNTTKPVKKLQASGISGTPAIRSRMAEVFKNSKEQLTWKHIITSVTGNQSKVWFALCQFVNEGLVLQVGKGKRGYPFCYYIAPGVTIEHFQKLETKFVEDDNNTQEMFRKFSSK